MQYILTHRATGNQYQVNLAEGVTIEQFRQLVESGQDILTLFNLNGTYAGVEPAAFIDECDITIGRE